MSEAVLELDTAEWDDLMQKLVSNMKRAQAFLKVAAQAFAFQDIDQHFRDEEGPDGPWAPRAEATQRRYAMIQSGQWRPPKGMRSGSFSPTNKVLQLTGFMRQATLPGNIEKVGSDAVRIFNNAIYSRRHNEGTDGMPKREFMWVSEAVQDKMLDTVMQLVLEDQSEGL